MQELVLGVLYVFYQKVEPPQSCDKASLDIDCGHQEAKEKAVCLIGGDEALVGVSSSDDVGGEAVS